MYGQKRPQQRLSPELILLTDPQTQMSDIPQNLWYWGVASVENNKHLGVPTRSLCGQAKSTQCPPQSIIRFPMRADIQNKSAVARPSICEGS